MTAHCLGMFPPVTQKYIYGNIEAHEVHETKKPLSVTRRNTLRVHANLNLIVMSDNGIVFFVHV